MKIELLATNGEWLSVSYTSIKSLRAAYPHAFKATDTDEYDYYVSNDTNTILFRAAKPERMTKEEAEKKYDIVIVVK